MAEQFHQSIDKALQTRSLAIATYSLTMDGEKKFFEARFLPLLEDQVIVVVHNITESRKAEQELADLKMREEEYNKIVEVASEGILRVEPDGMISFSNKKMAEMLGYNITEVVGRSYFSFMDNEGVKIAIENMARRRQGITGKYELRMQNKDGKTCG